MQNRNRHPGKRWLAVSVLVAGLMVQGGLPAYADPQDDLNRALDQQRQLEAQKQETQNALARVYEEAEEAQAQLDEVEGELAEATQELDGVSAQLTTAEAELQQVETDLQGATERYEERKEQLGTRVRAINEEGRISYVAVLLGSSSFGDFISRFDMLKMVVKQDSQLFDEIRAEKRELEGKREQVETQRNQLVALQQRAEERRNQVAERQAEHERASRTLDQRMRDLEAQLDAFDREAEAIQHQIWQLQLSMNRHNEGGFAPIYPVSSVLLTDVFGPRLHPILGVWRNHNGADFAASSGDPVYAIEDGVVIMAGWNDSYGNLVVIDHGDGIASWYGHSSELLVSVGDEVTQGQQISRAGSTGWSTGPHVHLEIHVNGEPQDPMTYMP